MHSLRARLLAWLLGAVMLTGIAGGFVIYRNALVEANAFFDYHLRETALLLRDQVYGQVPSRGLPQEVPQYDFVVQVWALDGRRLAVHLCCTLHGARLQNRPEKAGQDHFLQRSQTDANFGRAPDYQRFPRSTAIPAAD